MAADDDSRDAAQGAWARELRFMDHVAGEVFFGPRRRQRVPEDPGDPDLRLEATDRTKLAAVSHEFYGTPHLWWVIADASDVVDPFDVAHGTELRVPDLARVQAEVLR